jgi:hypothetical protein
MQPLEKTLRSKLERTVKEARDIAEAAAKAALQQLGVGEAKPFDYLSVEEKNLRRRLRAHGRQLGDLRYIKTEIQEIDRLVEEVAYEHWHRMLFARFLVENNLLMYPDPDDPVAISLEECNDLAVDEGAQNGWELASRYATLMLPQIFRVHSPVFKLFLPPEYQQKLERLLEELSTEVFTASDSLGWVYQFWQAKKKDEVNATGNNIGARELPVVTQLFTEDYMVSFLIDNTLGAWWAGKRLSKEDFKSAQSEAELRDKATIPGVSLEYLRFEKNEDESWTPAAGTFDDWPENLSELKTLDPCCGSGHFLVAVFLMLVPMCMELENLSAQEAVDKVLSENIHGLELDQRCVELAAFALALTAWNYPNAGGYRHLPKFHLACAGLPINTSKESWMKLAGENTNLRISLDWLYEDFKDAPILGSLINPKKNEVKMLMPWEEVMLALEKALSLEKSIEQIEAGIVAHGLMKSATLQAQRYHWVVTNVPYLTWGRQNDKLQDFCKKHYPEAKGDLANVFLKRCLELCIEKGSVSIVMTQNWLFLNSYKKQRKELLRGIQWNFLAKLGGGAEAFSNGPGNITNICMIILSKGLVRDNFFHAIDVTESHCPSEKQKKLCIGDLKHLEQIRQLDNLDARIILELDSNSSSTLSEFASALEGCTTGDSLCYVRKFWEIPFRGVDWEFYQTTVRETIMYGGREDIIYWQQERGKLAELVEFVKDRNHIAQNWRRGKPNWKKRGIVINQIGKLAATVYTGEIYDPNCCAIIPNNDDLLGPLWSFCSSPDFHDNVRKINQKMSVQAKTFLAIGFDVDYWTSDFNNMYPNGLPKLFSSDSTQWIFSGNPSKSEHPLQVAVIRLLGYQWPAEEESESQSSIELSTESLVLAEKCKELDEFIDDDGIVCIPAVRGEEAADQRLLDILVKAYGNEWDSDHLSGLLKNSGHAGKSLESWLREKFFTQHCQLFHHRPFIWQVWDGLNDGFSALINYHKLDKKLLETLIFTYLGDWINRQKSDLDSGIDGADEKIAAAENLKTKLELILEGEVPYDIFVRWKPVDEQPIGWEPDLNDGVRLNIRPFMSVPDVRKKGAGILRDKPNIKWGKDRGKDVETSPWYHLFKGDRINDHHLTLAEKILSHQNNGGNK